MPVVYRFKAEAAKKYVVCLAAPPNISGYYVDPPQRSGDLVFEYRVEGCAPKTIDCFDWITKHKDQPLFVEFEDARDVDGDGAIEVTAGVAASSRLRHTRLSAIWVFPEGTKIDKPESVTGGAMKDKCVRLIDVGATPEQDSHNQSYDKSDVSFARMRLDYAETIAAGETKTYWLRVPPVHRREPISMIYMGHAFRDILPGEAVPPFGPEQVKALQEVDPASGRAAGRRLLGGVFGPGGAIRGSRSDSERHVPLAVGHACRPRSTPQQGTFLRDVQPVLLF